MLIERIHAARDRLRDGSIRSEQAVSQSVVLPILDALGWPRSDPRFVVPEYSVGSGRVDFALMTYGRATVLVEVKQPGLTKHADEQLFQYAYHEGTQIGVLTDGKTWHVYGTGLGGTYDERKVARIDLLNDDPAGSVEQFERYLSREAVDSEQAEENIRADYRRLRGQRIARAELGKGWASLVAAPPLGNLLAAEVERACGFQPDPVDVAAFLAALRTDTEPLPLPRRRAVPARGVRLTEVHETRQEPPMPRRKEVPWSAGGWTGKGVTLPPGTELRGQHRGTEKTARVENGTIVFAGKRHGSPSAAGNAATGRSTNGWTFWEVKRPGDAGWVVLSTLRD